MSDKRCDWEVTVYRFGAVVGWWILSNRIEKEAQDEAEAEIQKEFPLAHDWTMERVNE